MPIIYPIDEPIDFTNEYPGSGSCNNNYHDPSNDKSYAPRNEPFYYPRNDLTHITITAPYTAPSDEIISAPTKFPSEMKT